jgi:hypothetical protein
LYRLLRFLLLSHAQPMTAATLPKKNRNIPNPSSSSTPPGSGCWPDINRPSCCTQDKMASAYLQGAAQHAAATVCASAKSCQMRLKHKTLHSSLLHSISTRSQLPRPTTTPHACAGAVREHELRFPACAHRLLPASRCPCLTDDNHCPRVSNHNKQHILHLAKKVSCFLWQTAACP